jgi:O-antigen/teichoic acid export membrane protein
MTWGNIPAMRSTPSWRRGAHIATAACVLVLLVLPFALFLSVTVGPYTQIPVDNLFRWQPFQADAAQFGIGLPQNELLSDLILQNYQWKRFTIESLRAGEIPLWNPYLFAGAPFLAAGQHSMLYPFSLLYLALPLDRAYGWFAALQMGIAGVCMFVFMRTFGLHRYSAVFAGVAYQLSGVMATAVVHPMIMAAAAWLPLILAMCERVVQQSPALGNRPSSMPWVVIGAFALAMAALAGHVEILIYTLFVTAAFCIWRVGTVIGFRNWRVDGVYLAGRVAWLGVMGVAGLAIGSIQLMPLFELVTRNFREGRSTYEQVAGYAFPIRYALQWFLPNVFGNPAHHSYFDLFSLSTQPVTTPSGNTAWGIKDYVEGAVYVGIPALIFAGVAIADAIGGLRRRSPVRAARRSTPPTWFFIALGIVSILLIFGTPLYALLFFGVPGFSQLHTPFRWKFPLTLCLAALGGIGLEILAAEVKARMPVSGAYRPKVTPAGASSGKAGRIGSLVTVGIGALLIVAVLAARLAWPALQPLLAGLVAAPPVAQGFTSPEMFFSYQARNVIGLGLAVLGSGLIWWLLRHRARDPGQGSRLSALVSALTAAAPALAIALLAIDLNLAWVGFNASVDPRPLSHTPAAIATLAQDTSLWRLTSYEPTGGREGKPLNANAAWLYDLQDIRGYDSIIPRTYTDYMKAIEPQGELLYNRVQPIKDPLSLESPLLDLLGVKYVVTEDEITTPGFVKTFDDGAMRVYRNTRAMPRAFTMPDRSTVVAPDFAQAIQQVDPRKHVVVSGGWTQDPAPVAADFAPANVTVYRGGEVWVDAEIAEPSWLILTDSYFPGWRAFVRPLGGSDADERETAVVPVNGIFRGVQLTPFADLGAVTVRFKYSPDSFRLGAFATFLSLVGMIFLGGIYVWRNLPRDVKGMSGVRLVARNSLILTGLNIVARLIDFVFALLMLRVLGPEGAGNYYFAVVIVGWFEIVLNFGLNTYLTREISRDQANAPGYLAQTSNLRLRLALGLAPVLVIGVLIWRDAFGLAAEAQIVILLLAISQIPSSLSTGLSAVFFAHEKAEVPAALTIVSALFKAGIGAALLLAGWGVVGLGVTSITVNLITLAILIVAAYRIFGFRFSILGSGHSSHQQSRSRILRESFPLMMNHLLATLFFKVDVPMLQAMKGPVVVGWYSAAYKFIDAFNIVPAFFTQSLFPAMSRMALQSDQSLARSYTLALKLLVIASLPLAIVTTFLAEPMIAILGGREFLPEGAIALAIMCWSMPIGWINSVTNYALIAANQQRALTRAFVLGLVFNVAANLVLISRFSFVGAAVVTILSELVEGAAFYVYVHRHIAPVNWIEALAKPLLAAGIFAAIAYAFGANGMILVGLAVGASAYCAVLWLTRALAPGEREILRPLIRRRV